MVVVEVVVPCAVAVPQYSIASAAKPNIIAPCAMMF